MVMEKETEVTIIGGGIGGLFLAISLHQIGIKSRVYESVQELLPLGAGINLLPHAVRELEELGLLPALDKVGIRTQDASYYNHHGQLIYRELVGQAAGYKWPQFSIHRGDLQMLLLEAAKERLGENFIVMNHKFTGYDQDEHGVTSHFVNRDGEPLPSVRSSVMIGCDGINSVLRHLMYPNEGEPIYSGYTIWRGVTPFKPFLSGADTIRAGWMPVGKIMVYPIRNNIDNEGNQLMNFVATQIRPKPDKWNFHGAAKLEDFYDAYDQWDFDWLDIKGLIKKTEKFMVYPMVDRDPLPTWTDGLVTLMGDAAHPMYPRGSNGAGQTILDARFITGAFKRLGVNQAALQEYDKERVAATGKVVLMNRANPPDTILKVVYERTGGKRFNKIEDVISESELEAILNDYKNVAGFQVKQLDNKPAYV
jgi:2-polyprenyl-6-methoxyphenol hydroxylase-like FAD-dependent oxidoreductase